MENIDENYQLLTTKLILRSPNEADIPCIVEATRTKGFNDGMLWEPSEDLDSYYKSLDRGKAGRKAGTGYAFSIDDRVTNEFLGRISIRKTKTLDRWNIGFWTRPIHQGKGVMKEACQGVLKFGFDVLGASCIEACYATWNLASEKVLKANGFVFEQHIPQGFQKKGVWVPENLMCLMREDWAKQ